MANLSNIIKLTRTQYNTLVSSGSITVSGVTYSYDSNAVYLVDGAGQSGLYMHYILLEVANSSWSYYVSVLVIDDYSSMYTASTFISMINNKFSSLKPLRPTNTMAYYQHAYDVGQVISIIPGSSSTNIKMDIRDEQESGTTLTVYSSGSGTTYRINSLNDTVVQL